jgi:hypothetical protein
MALALFVATAAVYRMASAPAISNDSDPLLNVPSSLSLLHDGDLDLSEYAGAIHPRFHGVLFVDGRPYNRYPVGTSLLVLPIVWLADRLLPPVEPPIARALWMASIAAKTLAAAGVALLFLLLVELTGRAGLALGLALVFGFATPHLPTHAGGLFSHNAVIPLLLVALLLLVHENGRRAGLAAPVLVFAFVTRPTCLPVIVFSTLYLARHRPDTMPRFALLGPAAGAAFVAWCLWMFGTVLPPYYWSYDHSGPYVMSLGRFAEGLAGHLVSPNRGVFVFAPILLFAVWGMWRTRHQVGPQAPLYRTLSLIVVTHWVMISLLARRWWGGWSYGPRHFAEMLPLLVVLLVPAIDAFRAAPRSVRAAWAPVVAAALGWSVFVAVHGATSPAPIAWNHTPTRVERHPERLWDWRDLQALRGVAWR